MNNPEWIRTHTVANGLEMAGALAHKAGFKDALEAWLGPETDAAGLAANQLQIANLIAVAKRDGIRPRLGRGRTPMGPPACRVLRATVFHP
jgi:hypothetical protein